MCSMNTDYAFEGFLTNLGKYNEGMLIGQWVHFPCTAEDLRKALDDIGINEQYEEYFMTDYDSDLYGLTDLLDEYTPLQTLNLLAYKIMMMDDTDPLEAALELGECTSNINEVVAVIDNPDCITIYPDVDDAYDLGYNMADECGLLRDIEDSPLVDYIDFESYGRDIILEEGGTFTSNGYACMTDWPTVYPLDYDELPTEYILYPAA